MKRFLAVLTLVLFTTFSFSFANISHVSGNWIDIGPPGFSSGTANYTSIAVSANGTAYIAITDENIGNKVTVMKYDGNSWISVGDSALSFGEANYTSMKFSPNGNLYIAFSDMGNGAVATVKMFNGNSWELVGKNYPSNGPAPYTSLAFSPDGTPYLAYWDYMNGNKATVVKLTNQEWVPVGNPGFSAGTDYYMSLAISSDGTPYVAYEDMGYDGKLTVMKYDDANTAWNTVGTPGFTGAMVNYTSLAISPHGNPYVAYQDGSQDGKATVMMFDGVTWNAVGATGFSENSATFTSIAITPAGTPYIAFQDYAVEGKTSFMMFNGIKWINVGDAGFSSGFANYISMTISPQGYPYVAYQDDANKGKATVMMFENPIPYIPQWESLGETGFLVDDGYYAMTISPDGTKYIAFQDKNHGNHVTVKKFDGNKWSNVGAPGFSPMPAKKITLACSTSGTLNVAYRNNRGGIRVMDFDGSKWNVVGATGVSEGFYRGELSLAISPDGVRHIAYPTDENLNKLTVKKYINNIWYTVGEAGFSDTAAFYVSMAISPSGTLNVAYSGVYGNVYKANVMQFDGTKWQPLGSLSFYSKRTDTSLKVSPDGTPYLSFIDGMHGNNTTVMKYQNGSWQTVGLPGFSNSTYGIKSPVLAISPDGTPYVSFWDQINDRILIMRYNGSSWINIGNPIDAKGGISTTIVMDADGNPYVAYEDFDSKNSRVFVKELTLGTYPTHEPFPFAPSHKNDSPTANNAPDITPIRGWQFVGEAGLSEGEASYQSLAISSTGQKYIAYRDEAYSNRATVMTLKNDIWEVVGTPGITAGSASNISLKISPGGTPNIAFTDDGTNKLSVMEFDGKKWNYVSDQGLSSGTSSYPSLAFSSKGTLYVAYQDNANNYKATVMEYNKDTNNWAPVGSPGFSASKAGYISLDISIDGTLYVAYQDKAYGYKATVMTYDNNTRKWKTVGPPGFSAGNIFYPSLAISSKGNPYVAYQDKSNSFRATVMRYDNNLKKWKPVDAPGISAGVAKYTSLAISPDDTPYVAYQDGSTKLKQATVMKFNGSKWEAIREKGITPGEASYLSLAISPQGDPYVAFKDGTNSNKATVIAFDEPKWQMLGDMILPSGNVNSPYANSFTNTHSYTTSLAISPSNDLYIVYGHDMMSFGNGMPPTMKPSVYKFDRNNNKWKEMNTEPIYTGAVNNPIITVSPTGTLNIIHQDYYNRRSRVVMLDRNKWIPVGNDWLSNQGSNYYSLVFTKIGSPYICYQDGGQTAIKKLTNNNWIQVGNTISPSGVAYTQAMALSSNDTPYIAIMNQHPVSRENNLSIMTVSGNNWISAGQGGLSNDYKMYSSIAISQDNTKYVAYVDLRKNGEVIVVKLNKNNNWEIIGKNGSSQMNGYGISFAILPNGTPLIAYSDKNLENKVTVMSYDNKTDRWTTVGSPGISAREAFNISLAIASDGTPVISYREVYKEKNRIITMKYSN